jgi:hypothetical protein
MNKNQLLTLLANLKNYINRFYSLLKIYQNSKMNQMRKLRVMAIKEK